MPRWWRSMSTPPASPADRLVTLPEGLPELTLGWEVVAWATKYLRHPNGPRVGQRWEFVNSQLRFLLWWYAVDDAGSWLYRHSIRRLAKGSGKSPFAALMALAEFTAPVRLADLDPSVLGGCVGRLVDMPLVQVVATSEAQTANTMRMVRALCPKGSRLQVEFGIDVGKTQFFRSPEGTLQQLTSSSSSAEGGEASFVVADETEHWRPGNGGPELAATLEDNLAKSGSRMLETCNSWVPGVGSVAEAGWDGWVKQEAGRTRGDARILYDARVAPPGTDLADEESLAAALDHVYGDCWWVDRRPVMERIWDPRSSEDDSRRKYLNQPTAVQDAWLTPAEWSSLADPSRVVADGDPVALFFDGSKSRDATALVGCRISDGHVFVVDAWEPDPSHTTEDVVPVAEVDATVMRAFDRYDVVAFFADVQEWESFVKVSWPDQFSDDLLLHAVPSGRDPQPVAWDMRTHVRDFTHAVELTEAEVVDRTFTHDGSDVLARHVGNARRAPNRFGVSLRKESRDSRYKIDAAVCMVGARMARRAVLSSPEWRNRQTKRNGVIVW